MTSATLNLGTRLRTAVAFTVLAACTTLGAVGSAHAATAADGPSVTVRYSDLDLSTEQGSRALYQRILAAAHQVCTADIRDLDAVAAGRECREQAIARAVRDVNSPKVASLYAQRPQHS